MDWRDEGVLLSARRHGESAAIVDVFTARHGRHAGVVRGGASRKMAPVLQPGAQVAVEWRARLEEHLGAYKIEPIRSRASSIMEDGDALAALGSAVALLTAYLGDREPRPDLYAATTAMMDAIGEAEGWREAYVGWEIVLLADLGYPLDLSRCAATGAVEDLRYVSPKSGKAVSGAAGAPYAERLFKLPAFLGGADPASGVADGLALTGYFLTRWVARAMAKHEAPDARTRLAERLRATPAPKT